MNKKLIFLVTALCLTACTRDEVLSDVSFTQPKDVNKGREFHYTINNNELNNPINDLFPEALAKVEFKFENKISSLHLDIYGIRLCNIYCSGLYHPATEYMSAYWETEKSTSSIEIKTEKIALEPYETVTDSSMSQISFIPQTVKAWNPQKIPTADDGCYLLLNCKIFNILDIEKGYQEGKDVMIWGGTDNTPNQVAIPLYLHLEAGRRNSIHIILDDKAPWYNIDETTPLPILHIISFTANVKDWETE